MMQKEPVIDANSPRPLYEQIKDYIRHNIQMRVFLPDTRIPSERELAKQFNVNRLTVNKALKDLIYEGVLSVQIGKGTFIKGAPSYNQQLETLTGFTEDMRSRGQSTASRVLTRNIMPAPDDIARILDVLPGTNLVALQRVRMADDQPMAVETSTLIASLCPGLLERYDFARESLYNVLRRDYGLVLAYAEQTIESRQATREEAEALHITVGSPVLYMTRVTYSEREKPIEYVRSTYRGDRYKFRAVLRQV
jgi:GntR family transcriptional regulator